MTMKDGELERMKARLEALERILRVQAIQKAGDAVDRWWKAVHDDDATAHRIAEAGKEAAKEALHTKNQERHRTHAAGTARRRAPAAPAAKR